MSISAPPTRSNVVLQQSPTEPVLAVAARLLGILGHDVALVPTLDAALAHDAGKRPDLLVITAADPDACVDRFALLPIERRPRQIVLLSEDDADPGPLLQRRLPGVKLRVLVKSVHALGLLDLIKRLDATRN